jgi:aspartyl-tRNA(Asn)/glutamyl-tRNA(Gln) amidotransferase subunit B
MNSFSYLERGVRAEIERQIGLLEAGEQVVQETLHFDPASGRITPLRSKEEAHDYRYFPEPDLVPLVATAEMLAAASDELPELPTARAERFERDLGLPPERARELAFRGELGDYFERALAAAAQPDGAQDTPSSADAVEPDGSPTPARAAAVELANWIPLLVERIGSDHDPAQSRVSPESFATLVAMVRANQVSRDAARQVLTRLAGDGGDPRGIVDSEGLGALRGGDDGELMAIVDRAIAADPDAAEKVRAGNMKAIGPLVGYVMRETKGRADGSEVTRLIRAGLAKSG